MKVTAICFGSFRDSLPPDVEDNKVVLELDHGATVGDVTDRLGIARRRVHAVFVDGRSADLSQTVYEGAEVTLMPQFTGG
jgi:molybdopterin converting factor small subunit